MFSIKKGHREASIVCGRHVAARLEDQKVFSLSPDQDNLLNKYADTNKNFAEKINLLYRFNSYGYEDTKLRPVN